MNEPIRIPRVFLLWAIASLPLFGCSWHTDSIPQTRPAAVVSPARQAPALQLKAAAVAREMVGVPYRYGGRTPRGFDCSGLVHYAYQSAGLDVPRTSAAQYRKARPIALRDAAPGDLLFFRGWRTVSHVGIYLGGNRFVHAPSTGRHVTITRLDEEYYRDRLVGIGRL